MEFLTVLGISYVIVCFLLARQYLSPRRYISMNPPEGLVETEIPSAHTDPAWCSAKLVHGKPSHIVFVFAHGYGGNRAAYAPIMVKLAEAGYDSVAPSMPGQDASPEPKVGFGTLESDAMVNTAKWVRDRHPGSKIVYAGISMGGASAWLASEKDPTAVGVVSEGGYARFDEAMHTWFEHIAPGASFYLRPVVWFAAALSGIQPSSVIPMNSAAKWNGRPALVIQAGDDKLILLSHAQRLAQASGCPLWIVPGAVHAGCFEKEPHEYIRHLSDFAKSIAK